MRPLAIPFHQHDWGLPCKDGSSYGEPQSPCVLGVHRRVYLHAATLSAFAYSPPTHNQHDWELSLASALPGGLLSRNQTFSVQVLLTANSHACWPQIHWEPNLPYFAFGSIHKPLVMACGVCCLHSSSVKRKSGNQTQNAVNAMNSIPIITFSSNVSSLTTVTPQNSQD